MSASHIGGLHRPVQKLDDTLIFALPRRAKMHASLAAPTKKLRPPFGGLSFFFAAAEIVRDKKHGRAIPR